jgi:hypothetical protein
LCLANGLGWQGLIASEVEQKAFIRALSRLAASDIQYSIVLGQQDPPVHRISIFFPPDTTETVGIF